MTVLHDEDVDGDGHSGGGRQGARGGRRRPDLRHLRRRRRRPRLRARHRHARGRRADAARGAAASCAASPASTSSAATWSRWRRNTTRRPTPRRSARRCCSSCSASSRSVAGERKRRARQERDERATRGCGARAFAAPPDPALMRLSRAESSYFRLAPYDIVASQAHARELLRAGILTAAEAADDRRRARRDRRGVPRGHAVARRTGTKTCTRSIERVLTATARAARRQAARRPVAQRSGGQRPQALSALRGARHGGAGARSAGRARSAQAARHVETLAPGFTHLQPAQPIVFAHQLLAHAQVLCARRRSLHRLGPAPRALAAGRGGAGRARRSPCIPSSRPPSSATTGPARTRSTPSAAAITWPSSSSSPR